MLTIYDKTGAVRCTVEPESNSQQDKVLQGDNNLSLSFTLPEYVALDVNDYVDFEGERYWMTGQYRPKEKSSMEWAYDIQLFGIESMIKRFLVIHNTDGAPEAVFALTAPAIEHVRLIVRSINEGMGCQDWKVGAVIDTANLTVDYEGTYCDEGLGKVATVAETEWWIDGTTVNLCRCEQGEELTLRYGHEITALERDNADGVKFYTRLFPIGSSRNIDRERYGHARLQLPEGRKFVDMNTEEYGIIHHYEEQAFSHIYPRRVGHVSSVRHEEVTNPDGEPFTIYYFKDAALPFDPNDYEIGGLVKHVVFQSGELNGRDFEVNYHSDTQEFEIITVWPYDNDIQVPGNTLIPQVGDDYILWNIRMPDEYYTLAEQEFLEAVEAYNQKHAVDVSVYKCPTDHTWVEESQEELLIGRRVRLESNEYFPATGYRTSRITRITRNVNLPSQMDLEISDALSSGTMTKITDSIQNVRVYVKESVSNIPDVVRSTDSTPLTDNNILSARRSQQEFISKKSDDVVQGLITFTKGFVSKIKSLFEKGLQIGANFISGTKNSGAQIDERGNGELESLVIRSLLQSSGFIGGFGGQGVRIYQDGNGEWNIESDTLTVRGTLRVYELLIDRLRAVGGQVVVSKANGKVKAVEIVDYINGAEEQPEEVVEEIVGGDGIATYKKALSADDIEPEPVEEEPVEVETYYKMSFEDECPFVMGDLIRCQKFTGKSLKHYWVKVVTVVRDYAYVSTSDEGLYSGVPAAGDEVVLCGNVTDTTRQAAILISAAQEATGEPIISVLSGINSRSFAGCLRTRLGYLGDINDAALGQLSGYGLYGDNVYLRGTFMLWNGNTYVEVGKSITAAVNNLEVGGRNLLLNSDFSNENFKYYYGWNYIYNTVEHITTDLPQGFSSGVQFVAEWGGYGVYTKGDIVPKQTCYPLQAGQHYTLSFYGRVTSGTPVENNFYYGLENVITNIVSLTSEWKRFSMTFTPTQAQVGEALVFYSQTAGNYAITGLKLERGDKATDWTPSEEDKEAKIEVLSNKIELSVTKNELKSAGITIDGEDSKISLNAKTTEVSDDLVVKRVLTNSGSSGVVASMANGIIKAEFGDQKAMFGINDNGQLVLQFWQNNQIVCDLSPDGLVSRFTEVQESWTEFKGFISLGNAATPGNWIIDTKTLSGTKYYQYNAGFKQIQNEKYYYNPQTGKYDLREPPQQNGKVFSSKSTTGALIADGWYRRENLNGAYPAEAYTDKEDILQVYWFEIFEFRNGKQVDNAYVWFREDFAIEPDKGRLTTKTGERLWNADSYPYLYSYYNTIRTDKEDRPIEEGPQE